MRFYYFLLIISYALNACNNSYPEENLSLQKARNPKERLASYWQKLNEQKVLVINGDLITRTGADVISSSFCNFNKTDKTYSHAGLAFIEGDQIYVYHTISGDDNVSDRMIREPFDSFCNPSKKDGIGVFRYNLLPQEQSYLHTLIKRYYKEKLLFDKQFDLKDDSKMYCAEMVLKALKQTTQNRILLPTTTVRNFKVKSDLQKSKTLKELEYVAIDNLYLNPFCKEIARIKFN